MLKDKKNYVLQSFNCWSWWFRCPAAENLVRAGIGTIGLIDNDIVSLSNIHRQTLFNSKDIKKSKVIVAAKNLKK